ncbi:MAG TPA: hypothetical protein PK937_14770 [bacterium]|nr:hypothetical protein [bacterium]
MKESTSSGGNHASVQKTLVHEHIVEIVSDSGEGAQKAGQSLGMLSAKMGNGVWTVEIIPAEIRRHVPKPVRRVFVSALAPKK